MARSTSRKPSSAAKAIAAKRISAKGAKPRQAVAGSVCRDNSKGPALLPDNSSAAANSASHPMGPLGHQVGECNVPAPIRFRAPLLRPKATAKAVSWTFLTLPQEASDQLPSRGQTTVEGTFNGFAFRATLDPDGQGGHWLKVERKLREAAGAESGDVITLEIAPVAKEPEPRVPPDLRKALASAPIKAREVWSDITPAARRDFIHWITSPKRPETRVKRVETACDMLAKGKRRPCCFDRSGMYDKSLSCPEPADE